MNLNQIQSTVKKKKITSVIGAVVAAGAVTSVFGRTGAITAQNGDYTYSQISGRPTALSQFTNDVGFLTVAVTSLAGTANQIIASAATGAVTLSLPNPVAFPGIWTIGTLPYSDTGILWSAQSSTNSYNQAILQNTSNGASASTNLIFSNDAGTSSTHYLEIGKNSSGFSNGAGSFNLANASYLDDATDDLVIGTLSNKTLHFVTNNSATDNLSITGAGVMTFNGSSTAIHKEIFNNLGTTQTDGAGIWFQNSISATLGQQQISPAITLEGQGWSTTSSQSQTVKVIQDILPVVGATTPSITWRLRSSINGSAYADMFTISNSNINFPNGANFQVGGVTRLTLDPNAGGAVTFTHAGSSSLWSPAITSIVGNNTSLTANTEFLARDFRGAIWTFSDGTVPTQRFNYFKGFTVNKLTTSATFTDIYNVYIDQSAFNTGVTFTNNWALGVNGNMKILDGFNIGFGTTTGTIIGIATTQKLSFWGKTPIVQPTTAIGAATRVGGGGTTITDTDTFGGYTLAKLAAVIINSGLAA